MFDSLSASPNPLSGTAFAFSEVLFSPSLIQSSTRGLRWLMVQPKRREFDRETGYGYLPLETVRCLGSQGPMCGRAILPNKKSPRDFRRLMKLGGFLLLPACALTCIPDQHPKNLTQPRGFARHMRASYQIAPQ